MERICPPPFRELYVADIFGVRRHANLHHFHPSTNFQRVWLHQNFHSSTVLLVHSLDSVVLVLSFEFLNSQVYCDPFRTLLGVVARLFTSFFRDRKQIQVVLLRIKHQ